MADSLGGNTQPDWLSNASIYQVNLRQYTSQGTINAFREKLPTLKELDVKILLLMPLQPIGVKNRQGGLGNSYAIRDYTSLNPEFGSMDDFKRFVTAAHDAGFKVVMDWPASQTSIDGLWVEKHPDWFTSGKSNADVKNLNYARPEVSRAMIGAMQFWIRETNVDGFHAHSTESVPLDFWKEARLQLDSIKPILLISDAEGPQYHDKTFNISSGRSMYELMNSIANGEKETDAIFKYLKEVDSTYPAYACQMLYTTNYEENSHGRTLFERMPLDYKSMFVMAATLPNSIPMIYSGQEFGLKRPLRAFEKDTITASDSGLFNFYRKVLELKNTHPALAVGSGKGDFEVLRTHPISDKAGHFFAYIRKTDKKAVLVLLNFSDSATSFSLSNKIVAKPWVNIMTAKAQPIQKNNMMEVPAHGFLILTTER